MSSRNSKKAKAERRQTRQPPQRVHHWQTRMDSSSHRRKLAWAKTHIDAGEVLIAEWSAESYRVTQQTDSQGRTRVFGELVEPIPDQLGLVVGDAFQCLRHSLDHIVFALSKKATPNMTADEEGKTSFPITAGTVAVKPSSESIRYLDPLARQAVLDLTPDPTTQQVNNDPLFLLNKMGNRDKHREIPLLALSHFPGVVAQ